jgi:hypothetical protein
VLDVAALEGVRVVGDERADEFNVRLSSEL